MSERSPTDLLQRLASEGFAIAATLPRDEAAALAPSVRAWLASVPAQRSASVLIVGNDAALWPRFIAAYRRDEALRAEPHPLDTFVEQRLSAVVGSRAIAFAHRQYDGAFLPMQRLAVAARLGWVSRHHLVTHPEVGPWWSIRALVALDDADPVVPGPVSESDVAGCPPELCGASCAALAAAASRAGATWEDHYAARRGCRVAPHRQYSEAQARYHYTHDPQILTALVGEHSSNGDA